MTETVFTYAMRRLRRAAGTSAATLIPIFALTVAPLMASEPTPVDTWFAHLTVDQVMPFLSTLPSWQSIGSDSAKTLTFGDPSPTLGFSIPDYDLATGEIAGSTQLRRGLSPTGGYCARALVGHKPIDVVVCGEPDADGSYQVVEASDVHFLGASADLPSGGTTAPDHDFVGVEDGVVVPMDPAAKAWLGASSLNGAVFIRLVAQQKAEWKAVDQIDGPTVGGGIPLIGGDRAAVAAFEASVAKGSGVPVGRLSHPWTVAEAATNAASAAGSTTGTSSAASSGARLSLWLVPSALVALLAALAAIVRRRQRLTIRR